MTRGLKPNDDGGVVLIKQDIASILNAAADDS
jgi:hypothetical protein